MSEDKRDKVINLLMEALDLYADPYSYLGIAFLFDQPCGEFAEDFEDVSDAYRHFKRPMPGGLARETQKTVDNLLQEIDNDT